MDVFYIVKCASLALGGGIYGYQYDQGSVKQLNFVAVECPSYINYSRDRRFVFVASESRENGGVLSLKVNPDHSLTIVSQQLSSGGSVCYVASDPEDKILYAANYRHGRVEQYALDDGKIGLLFRSVQHEGHGPNPKRQEAAHVHFTQITPDNRYLAVVDLGIDSVLCYPMTPNGLDEKNVKVTKILPAGSGPRHIAFAKDGRRAWLVNELANTVVSMNYEDGRFELVQTLPMIPPAFTGFSKAAAIRLSPDEKFVYASNRGYDTVAVFRILPGNLMAFAGSWFTGVHSLRDINFVSDTKFAAGGETSHDVYFFDYDPETGALKPDGNVIPEIERPICILH